MKRDPDDILQDRITIVCGVGSCFSLDREEGKWVGRVWDRRGDALHVTSADVRREAVRTLIRRWLDAREGVCQVGDAVAEYHHCGLRKCKLDPLSDASCDCRCERCEPWNTYLARPSSPPPAAAETSNG